MSRSLDGHGQPYVLPVAYARAGDAVLVHGSTGSRLFRGLADGVPTCLTVTLLDGLVVARSVFESSMHYRSAMVLGVGDAPGGRREGRRGSNGSASTCCRVGGPTPAARTARSSPPPSCCRCRWTSGRSRSATARPRTPTADLDLPVWAGVVPLAEVLGAPVPAPDLRGDPPVPAYVGGVGTVTRDPRSLSLWHDTAGERLVTARAARR